MKHLLTLFALLCATEINAQANVRDNKFKIITTSNPERPCSKLINGEYYVKEHLVTSGQPNDVKNGDTLTCDASGEFNFRIGLKVSAVVAKWFNQQCDAKRQTTFGGEASELSFAFLGTLRLTCEYHGAQHKIIFDDILIAHRNLTGANIWHFGGKNCEKVVGTSMVETKGSTEKNASWLFTFLSGNGATTKGLTDINAVFLF